MNAFLEKLQKNISVFAYCLKHQDSPLLAKLLVVLLLSYLLSPIDLIPDFIPVIGLLDELLILSIGMYLLVKIVPAEIMQAAKPEEIIYIKWLKVLGAIMIVMIWSLAFFYFWNLLK